MGPPVVGLPPSPSGPAAPNVSNMSRADANLAPPRRSLNWKDRWIQFSNYPLIPQKKKAHSCSPASNSTLIPTTQLVEMPSAAPRGDDLDANYVNQEYDVQPMGAQNHADTTFRVATSMLSRSLSPLKTMARIWKALGYSLP